MGEAVERLRWVKDAEEIALLDEAQSCTDAAFEEILDTLAVGMTERQVALELEHALRRAGADGLSFESIVAFGEQAAEPHHHPTHRVLEEGDVIKMDFAGLYGGYHADMTRTIAFGSPAGRAAEDPRRGAPGAAGGDRRHPRGHDRRADRRGRSRRDRRRRIRLVLHATGWVTGSGWRSTRDRTSGATVRTSCRSARS